MKPGDQARITRSFGAAEIAGLDDLVDGAADPACVPEPLIAALFSYLLGVELPGAGTNYLKQDMKFLAAAKAGDALSACVTITRVRAEKHLVDLATTCHASDGTLICEGRALVLAKDVAGRPGHG